MVISAEDLAELIKQGESKTQEFKENFDKEAIQTAGALANTMGGIILIGVNRHGTIKGITISKETLKNWANRISNASEPTLIPDVHSVDIKGKSVVVISVKEFPQKPVAILGRCYRRVGTSNRVMTPGEITEMHLHSMGMSWDAVPHPDRKLKDIEYQKVKDYISRTRKTGRRKFRKDEKPADLLQKLTLIKDGAPTWASIIAFGERPPIQAKVKCGKIRGMSTIVDDFVVDAPLLDQVDEVMDYMRRILQLSYKITGKARRDEIWEYPLEAVREVVTNAICHRDYASPAEIQIKIFDDRLVIWNPGGLPFGMTVEKLMDPNHNSVPRNKLIAMLFYDTGLIERYGSGIRRIFEDCDTFGFPHPEFGEMQGGLQVIFRKDIYTEGYLVEVGLNDRQIKIVAYVKEHGEITNREYQRVAGTSERTALRDLNDLCERGLLEKVGKTGRGTIYILAYQKNLQTRQKPAMNPPKTRQRSNNGSIDRGTMSE